MLALRRQLVKKYTSLGHSNPYRSAEAEIKKKNKYSISVGTNYPNNTDRGAAGYGPDEGDNK